LKSGAFRLFLGIATLICITLMVVNVSRIGQENESDSNVPKQDGDARLEMKKYRAGMKQMKELRNARSEMRSMAQRRHAAGLRPIEQNVIDPAAAEKKNAGHVTGDSAGMRNEIKYKVSIYSPNPSGAVNQLQKAIRRAGLEDIPELSEGMEIKLMIPQTAYNKFVENLQSLGKLKLERTRFRSDTPPSAPVPFEITKFKDEKAE